MKIDDIIKFAEDKNWTYEKGASFVDELSEKITGRIARSRHVDVTFVLYIIKELMGEKCKTILDIGTLWGGSTITMMQSEYPSTFITIDLFDGYYNQYAGERDGFGPEDPVTGLRNTVDIVLKNMEETNIHKHPCYLIKGNSSDEKIINRIKGLTDSIDLLFIDGDHTKKGVLKDWNNYSEIVSKGGIVVFDDYWKEDMIGKGGWTDKKWMDIVGAYEEIKNQEDFDKNWKEIGLFGDKKIVERL